MIRHIIFDMGNVLSDYNPQHKVAAFTDDQEDQTAIRRAVFESPEWAMLDRGTITEDEALKIWLTRLPARLHEVTEKVFRNWHLHMLNLDEMTQLVRSLKEKGLGLYILSNASVRFEKLAPHLDAFKYMDGYIVSAFHKVMKPERRIYEILFETFGLKPEECFFIDDAPQNIQGAKNAGMDGHVFTGDVEALKRELSARLHMQL